MTKAVRIHDHGGPEVLTYEDIELAAPAAGEVQIKFEACGLNFIDCYQRSGLYPMSLPTVLGMEGAGTITALGDGVSDFEIGQRVCLGRDIGCYAEARNVSADAVIPLPDDIAFETSAGMMLKGMTTHYLLKRSYEVKEGDTILFHAAAGGVGLIACQWAKALGATVIGTVGSKEKAELAKAHGCDHTILYKEENITEAVKDLTNGEGVPVVYDSVGADTFIPSLDSLRPLGMMVSYGNASGPVPAFSPLELVSRGSLFFTRPSLMHYVAKRDDLLWAANDLFDMVSSGKVKIDINQKYALADIQQAHTDLESRKTTGSTIFLP